MRTIPWYMVLRFLVWVLIMVTILVAASSYTDPFELDVQARVLKKVAKIMQVTLNPNIPSPTVLRAEEVSNEYNNSVWGFDVGDKRSNIFDIKTNTILLIEDAEIHNLAHEMAHYIQFNYFGWTGEESYLDLLEWEAIRVQNHFR